MIHAVGDQDLSPGGHGHLAGLVMGIGGGIAQLVRVVPDTQLRLPNDHAGGEIVESGEGIEDQCPVVETVRNQELPVAAGKRTIRPVQGVGAGDPGRLPRRMLIAVVLIHGGLSHYNAGGGVVFRGNGTIDQNPAILVIGDDHFPREYLDLARPSEGCSRRKGRIYPIRPLIGTIMSHVRLTHNDGSLLVGGESPALARSQGQTTRGDDHSRDEEREMFFRFHRPMIELYTDAA
jgi:hypothetical protein